MSINTANGTTSQCPCILATTTTTNPYANCDTRIGVSFIAQSACLSCVAVVSLLSYVACSAFRNRRSPQWHFIRSHLDLYLLGLLMSDLVQSMAGIMDIRWISKSGVFEGHFCTAQGIIYQLGDVGVALCSIAIAAHTFAELILRWKEPPNFTIPLFVLALYGIFLALITGVGSAVHRHSDYFGNTTYWCWIKKSFIGDGIGLEYAWFWIAGTLNLFLYVPVFLALKHIIVVEPTSTCFRYRVKWTTKEERLIAREQAVPVNPRRMLYYPAVYLVTTLPISLARIPGFVSSIQVPFAVTAVSCVLFSASGLFNVIVYTSTRPALLRSSGRAADVTARRHHPPKVFLYSTEAETELDMSVGDQDETAGHSSNLSASSRSGPSPSPCL
ncbi:hypothetical protein JB92DRAFT_2955111 [Gautieria morchelliformis]|nr:hypothetical protein JB92DRAFT_2955111 [Gautieria morchelliformis]